jgi:AcrR family transcriptional regulator
VLLKKEDRRVRRTRQSLHQALMNLTLEKGYEAVTVSEILARADVGRSTFYAHYAGKEGLLLGGLQVLRDHLIQQQRDTPERAASAPGRALGFSGALFEHVNEHRDLYRALGQQGGNLVLNRMRGMLADLVRAELGAGRLERAGDIPRSALIQFVSDSLISLIRWWLEKNPRFRPAEVEAIFRRLVVPAFAAATRD